MDSNTQKTETEPLFKAEKLHTDFKDSVIHDKEHQTIIIHVNKGKKTKKAYIYYERKEEKTDIDRARNGKIPIYPIYEFTVDRGTSNSLTFQAKLVWEKTKDEQGNEMIIWDIENLGEVVDKIYRYLNPGKDKSITKDLIVEALISFIRQVREEAKEIDVVDYIQTDSKMRMLYNELKNNPEQFVIDHTKEIIGNEELKIKVLYAIVSSVLEPDRKGINRFHIIINGKFGSGKTSTVESVLDLFFSDDDGFGDYIWKGVTRLTKNALGYIGESLDGKIIYVKQMDNIEEINYLRDALDSGRIETYYPCKDPETGMFGECKSVVRGQPVFISTNVSSRLDEQLLSRVMQLYLRKYQDLDIAVKIMDNMDKPSIPESERLKIKLVTYAWLKSLPKKVGIPENVTRLMTSYLLRVVNSKNVFRAREMFRNLVKIHTIMHGHDVARPEDVEEVWKMFKKDLLLTAHVISEMDVELLIWFRDHGFVEGEDENGTIMEKTSNIASDYKMAVRDTKIWLERLYNAGLLDKRVEGNTTYWCLTRYGLKLLADLEGEEQDQQQPQTTEQPDFQPDDIDFKYLITVIARKSAYTRQELFDLLTRKVQIRTEDEFEKWIKLLIAKKVIKQVDNDKFMTLVKWENGELVYT